MGVSATGETGLSTRSIRSLAIVFSVFAAFAIYFYGPAVTPGFRNAATSACNDYAGGNFRDYVLTWESGPGTSPHWSCWDRSRPQESAVSFGWWVNPFS